MNIGEGRKRVEAGLSGFGPLFKARFEKKFSRGKEDKCWIWEGAVLGDGYGVIKLYRPGRCSMARAHRISYEMYVGPVPDGLLVCHHCDVPLCVNPNHLFIGDQAANMADRKAKGRYKTRNTISAG